VSETQTPDSLADESIGVMIQNSAQWRRKDVVAAPDLLRHLVVAAPDLLRHLVVAAPGLLRNLVGGGNLLVENKILKVFKNIKPFFGFLK